MEELDHVIDLFQAFGGLSTLVSIMAAPVCIPTNMNKLNKCSLFLTSMPIVVIIYILILAILIGIIWISKEL